MFAQQVCMDRVRVGVIGAGVVGLSTALCVAETLPNCSVTVIAEKFSPHTTSDVAAGILSPHLNTVTPVESLRRWFAETFAHIYSIARSTEAPDAGVQILSGWEIFKQPPEERIPFWSDIVLAFHVMSDSELKRFPETTFGWMYTTLLCECLLYLPWLEKRNDQRTRSCCGNPPMEDVARDGRSLMEDTRVETKEELAGCTEDRDVWGVRHRARRKPASPRLSKTSTTASLMSSTI